MSLTCRSISVHFDGVPALDALDLSVSAGSVTAVVGPSGCGKSTLLRAIAGLQPLDAGRIEWNGSDVTDQPVHERNFGLMFQDYALFPHRNVEQNVGFGLRMAGMDPAERRRLTAEMLDLVGLSGFANRTVDGLSGGEQQRVALARTLAPSPALLMLDEPIGSLDRTLRDRLVSEMREIFGVIGRTVIYVTHDQDEAFALADEVVVMNEGRVVAAGSPARLWADPGSEFVARFLGHDNIVSRADLARLGVDSTDVAEHYLIRREAITTVRNAAGNGSVVAVTLRSGLEQVQVEVAGLRLVTWGGHGSMPGESVDVSIDPGGVLPLHSTSEGDVSFR